jgi:hypothetical protein
VSYGGPSAMPDSSASPLPIHTNATHRTNAGVGRAGGYVSPDYPKPRTPYEDKVIPTLRNRNRADGGHTQGSVMAGTDAAGANNEETESVYGGTNPAPNDDATAELNQAEMIEANQMMVVFDKQLVRQFSSPTVVRSSVSAVKMVVEIFDTPLSSTIDTSYSITSRI